MARFYLFACSAFALTANGAAAETATVMQSADGNHATIIQSGPLDDKSAVDIRKGPGFVVMERRSDSNRAVIIQGKSAEE